MKNREKSSWEPKRVWSKANSFRRKGEHGERWNREELDSFKGLPWEPIPGREGLEIKTSVHIPGSEQETFSKSPVGEEEGEATTRRVRIERDDVKKFGKQ